MLVRDTILAALAASSGLPVDAFSDDFVPGEVMDSLDRAEALLSVEDDLSVYLEDSDFPEEMTVKQLIDLVESRLGPVEMQEGDDLADLNGRSIPD